MIVRGVLDGGGRLEWTPSEAATIYVGSDPTCQWRVTAAGVAPFHWHLCWYARRLWMAELEAGQGGAPRTYKWTMAPIGVVLRLGAAVMVFELGSAAEPARQRRGGPSDPTLILHSVPDQHGAGADVDLDATQIIAPDDLRALPPFGPSSMSRALPPALQPPSPQSLALEDMFIVPAQQAAPPPKPPGPLARLTAVVPARMLIALIAASGLTVLTFLPDRLHADHEEAAPAHVPPRRASPEPEIEMHAVAPDLGRSAAEAAAAGHLAAGRLEEALSRYRELQEAAPDDPVFRDFAAVIERRLKSSCRQGDCAEGNR